MELPYYKINEVSELLHMPISEIIRHACSGKIIINILTAKFTVYESFQELKHNFPYDEYQDDIDEALTKYEEEFQSDSLSLEYDVCNTEYIKVSKKCLLRYESGELDAKVSISCVDANDNYFVHFKLLNKNIDIPAIQDCELIILKDDLISFQTLINKDNQINLDTSLITIDDKDAPTLDTIDSPQRKKKKPLIRVTTEGLDLIHYIFDKYNINYLDQMSGVDAWGKIVSGEIKHSLIQDVTSKFIVFNDDSRLTKPEFLEKYRKRFV